MSQHHGYTPLSKHAVLEDVRRKHPINNLTTIIVMSIFLGYIISRLLSRRSVTRGGLLLPIGPGLYVEYSSMPYAHPATSIFVPGGAFFGILLGLISGQLVHVWCDETNWITRHQGDWLFVCIYLGIIAVRFAAQCVLQHTAFLPGAETLNGTMLAMSIRTSPGRSVNIALRALALNCWDYSALPGRREQSTTQQDRHLLDRCQGLFRNMRHQ